MRPSTRREMTRNLYRRPQATPQPVYGPQPRYDYIVGRDRPRGERITPQVVALWKHIQRAIVRLCRALAHYLPAKLRNDWRRRAGGVLAAANARKAVAT